MSSQKPSLQTAIANLLGVPYKWWDPSVSCAGDHGPFWAFNGPLPSRQTIEEGHMNCAGFVNLICRTLSIPIPGADANYYYAGGTRLWYEFLKDKGVLKPFKPWIVYPEGTLLLRDFKHNGDEGHLAIYMSPNCVAHAWPTSGSCFAAIEPAYYEWICLPEDWMV